MDNCWQLLSTIATKSAVCRTGLPWKPYFQHKGQTVRVTRAYIWFGDPREAQSNSTCCKSGNRLQTAILPAIRVQAYDRSVDGKLSNSCRNLLHLALHLRCQQDIGSKFPRSQRQSRKKAETLVVRLKPTKASIRKNRSADRARFFLIWLSRYVPLVLNKSPFL